MRIGIIGAGHIGSALAGHLQRVGHSTLIANSRGPETLNEVSRTTGATPVTLLDAAREVDLLILSIPLKNVTALPADLLANLPASSPVIDTGNYYPFRDGAIATIDQGMVESVWTAHELGRPVIKAFNNITADSLLHKGLPKGSDNRIALPVAGDDQTAKRCVMALLDQIGFDALDAGPLSESWRYQPGTPAYCPDPTVRQLAALLEKADRSKAAGNRDKAAAMMAKLPADFPPQDLVRTSRIMAGLDTLNLKSWAALLRVGVSVLRP